MRSSTEEGILQDIRENPADDLPRLVYADWLEDQGDETSLLRARLIRVQCGLAAAGEGGPRREALEEESNGLIEALHGWMKPLRDLVNHCDIERGMVAWVTISSDQLIEQGHRLPELAPVAEVTLDADGPNWDRVLASPNLRHVHRFEARSDIGGDDAAEALGRSPHLGQLRALTLHGCSVTGACVPDLLRLDLSRLELLNLGANNLGDPGMALLCEAPQLANLRDLGVGGNDLHRGSASALATSPVLHRLNRINIGANYLDDASIELIARTPHLSSLRELDVRANEFHQGGAFALAGSPYLGNLTFLDVSGNRFRARAREALRQRFGARLHF